MSRVSRAGAFRTTLAGVVLVASLILAGCGDKSEDEPEPDSTPTGQPSETVVAVDHYDCPVDGYTIPALELGGSMDVGGRGWWYETACFTVESPTTVTALAYPLAGDQAQSVHIFSLDPEATGGIPAAYTDWFRSDPEVSDLFGENLALAVGAYGQLPYESKDLEPGVYMVVVKPTNGGELDTTRLAIFADGADHFDEFLASDNAWVVEQAARGTPTCSPEGHEVNAFPLGWDIQLVANGNEWRIRCFTLDEPTTISVMARPTSSSQDLMIDIVSLSPSGEYTLKEIFDQYRVDPVAPDVALDVVFSADDEIGALPWGMVDLPAGEYVIIVTPYEAVPLENTWVKLTSDGEDHIDEFFGVTDNPFVVGEYEYYLDNGLGN